MKFGAMNFPVMPLLEEIDAVARLEFDYIEIAMDPPMAHYSILANELKAICQRLEKHELGVVCHLPTFVLTADLTESLRRASVTEMLRSLSVAGDLGAQKVVLHPSMAFGLGAFVLETVKNYAFDFLAEMVSAAERLNITICLENMMPNNMLGVEPDDFSELFSTFPSLRLTLDTGHANIADHSRTRLIELVERFGNRIGHLHFSDNYGMRDDHLSLGEGTIKFKQLIRHLKATNYNDTLTLEIFDQDRGELVRSRDYITKLLDR